MGKGFENDRKWLQEKKNDVAIRTMEYKEKVEELSEKKQEFEEGIARIPTDLPDDLSSQIQSAIDNARLDIQNEAKKLDEEGDNIRDTADEMMDVADMLQSDYLQKASQLNSLRDIPIVGNFVEKAGGDMADRVTEIQDLRQETQKYEDELAAYQNRVRGR